MYFCNAGFCPTKSSSNSTCQSGQFNVSKTILFFTTIFLVGKFGNVPLSNNDTLSFQLKVSNDGIDGEGQQCLIYYYYMPAIARSNITVKKEEKNGQIDIIDSVSDSPFNGWIKRKINFASTNSGYNV